MCSAYVLAAAPQSPRVVVLPSATMDFIEPNPTSGVNRRRHCGLVSELQEFETRMSESDLNTYKLQLQQVEAALTTDPENEVRSSLTCKRFKWRLKCIFHTFLFRIFHTFLFQELQQLKTDLEQVLALTQDLINAQLGASAGKD